MRVVVVTKERTEYTRMVETFLTDFTRQTGHQLETVDPDAPAGSDFCQVYDVMEYPSVLAISDDGQIQNSWSGTPLPTISEVSYYV